LNEIWQLISGEWKKGHVLVTVGTGSLSPEEEEAYGLVGDHNYSIFG
jgi:calpain-7